MPSNPNIPSADPAKLKALAVNFTRSDLLTNSEFAQRCYLLGHTDAHRQAEVAPYPEHTVNLAELEKRAIVEALHVCDGKLLQAASLLRIGKTTLYRKVKDLGLKLESDKTPHFPVCGHRLKQPVGDQVGAAA